MSLIQAITNLCQSYNIDSKSLLKTIQSQLVNVQADAKGQPCSIDGCKVQRCSKPKTIDGKIVCSTHYKILEAKEAKQTSPKCMHIHSHGQKTGQTCSSKSVKNGYCNRHQKHATILPCADDIDWNILSTFTVEPNKLRTFVLDNKAVGYIDKRYPFVFSKVNETCTQLQLMCIGYIARDGSYQKLISESSDAPFQTFVKKVFFSA